MDELTLYKKMYATLCGGMDDFLQRLEELKADGELQQPLRRALEEAEELFVSYTPRQDREKAQ